eukprot:TRINITY_DN7991_c0_g1_i2.p1 TRINITY_DN7991_c0_g1~~TRINITY_DN7991_c0_g1_i2.p1  ORF type:complete len:107 (-),score=14.68 TRINITY_DN7991_c0_g1_i2:306-626(-)
MRDIPVVVDTKCLLYGSSGINAEYGSQNTLTKSPFLGWCALELTLWSLLDGVCLVTTGLARTYLQACKVHQLLWVCMIEGGFQLFDGEQALEVLNVYPFTNCSGSA